ncbi:MAG: flagellin [Thiobacillus sp.]|nr:flagellin [Thiobacillus sp.]
MAIGDVSLTGAMRSNLVSLQQTATLMGQTQERLSTGKRVNSALDNPANFFAAREHTQRANLLNGLKDSIGEAIQTVKAADKSVTAITKMIEGLRGQLSQARTALGNTQSSGTLLSGVASGYNEMIRQLNNLQQDSNYNGITFLASATVLTVNFNETSTTKLVMSGFDGTASGLGISGGTVSGYGSITVGDIASTSGIDGIETSLNAALATLRKESSTLSNNLTILSVRQSFITDMVNTLAEGSDNLTLADTNEEGANMLMLQTRQQLGTTSLSLASQAAQSVLRLFG